MHRFYVPSNAEPNGTVEFSLAQAHQLAKVLRLHASDVVEAFDGRGGRRTVELTVVRPDRAVGTVLEVAAEPWPFPWRVTLCLALIRPQRFEWAVEKAAELGVWAVVPTVTERCMHGDASTGGHRLTRWQQIAIEAAEQCGSAFVPEVRPVARFDEALAAPAGVRLFAWEGGNGPARQLLLEVLASLPGDPVTPTDVALFIGPEGGFAPREVQAAHDAGCGFVSLGPLTLRAETAAVAALAVLAQAKRGG